MVGFPDEQVLRDAARVHALSGEVRAAVAALAVSPLDESSAERMRALLGGRSIAARDSLERLRLLEPSDSRGDGA